MGIPISGLPAAVGASSADIAPIVQSGTTKKATAGMLAQAGVSANITQQHNAKLDGISGMIDGINGLVIKTGTSSFAVPVNYTETALTINSATYQTNGIPNRSQINLTGNGTKTITLDASYAAGIPIGYEFYFMLIGTGNATFVAAGGQTVYGQTFYTAPTTNANHYVITCRYVAMGEWSVSQSMNFTDAVMNITGGEISGVLIDASDIGTLTPAIGLFTNCEINRNSGSTDYYRAMNSDNTSNTFNLFPVISPDSGGNPTNYTNISVGITDRTNGSEDATMTFQHLTAGSMINRLSLNDGGATLRGSLSLSNGTNDGLITYSISGSRVWTFPDASGIVALATNATTLLNFTGAYTLNSVVVTYNVTGKLVTLSFPDILSTATVATILTSTALPSALWPAAKNDFDCRITDNGAQPLNAGLLRVATNGVITIYKDLSGGSFSGAGSTGLQGFSVTYISV